jgi:hypothetical protein
MVYQITNVLLVENKRKNKKNGILYLHFMLIWIMYYNHSN